MLFPPIKHLNQILILRFWQLLPLLKKGHRMAQFTPTEVQSEQGKS
jgi:hypothetical protein